MDRALLEHVARPLVRASPERRRAPKSYYTMAGIAPAQLFTAARVRVAPSTRGPAASPDSQLPERDRRRLQARRGERAGQALAVQRLHRAPGGAAGLDGCSERAAERGSTRTDRAAARGDVRGVTVLPG